MYAARAAARLRLRSGAAPSLRALRACGRILHGVKTHPHLLVRDALASLFVRAAGGDASARGSIAALAGWARGESVAPELLALCAGEDAPEALFAPAGLSERFAGQDAYARDRARRLAAALGWIDEGKLAGNPLECARAAWDAGLFFEVHEILEPVWLREAQPRRDALQGLIMAGAALHHLCSANLSGAKALLRDAVRHLERAPDALPLELSAFAAELAALADALEQGRVRSADDMRQAPALRVRT